MCNGDRICAVFNIARQLDLLRRHNNRLMIVMLKPRVPGGAAAGVVDMKNRQFTLMAMLLSVMSCKMMAVAVTLTASGLGLSVGDQGHSITVDGAFTVSARTTTAEPGGYNNANVWVNSSGMGAYGDQPPHGNVGLDALQGGDDELVFDFETTVSAASVVIGLKGYNRNADGTTFRLVDAHDGSETLLSDSDWLGAATFGKANSIVIDLGELFSVDDGTSLASLTIGQTAGSVYVSSIEFTNTEIPEPTTLAMLGVGCLVFIRKKKA